MSTIAAAPVLDRRFRICLDTQRQATVTDSITEGDVVFSSDDEEDVKHLFRLLCQEHYKTKVPTYSAYRHPESLEMIQERFAKFDALRQSVIGQSRQELLDSLEWNSGGHGFGIPAFAGAMLWASDRPTAERPDLKSIVAVCMPQEKYTDDELREICAFARLVTGNYDELFGYRRGCNMLIIEKYEGEFWKGNNWMIKRMSWEYGTPHHPSVQAMVAWMEARR